MLDAAMQGLPFVAPMVFGTQLKLVGFYNLAGLDYFHNGLALPNCSHDSEPCLRTFHGIHSFDDLLMILHYGGIMRNAHRTESGNNGWYHSDVCETALQYAGPTMWKNLPCKLVLQFQTLCCNKVHTGLITKHNCLRYQLKALLIVPLYLIPPRSVSNRPWYAEEPYCMRFSAYLEAERYASRER